MACHVRADQVVAAVFGGLLALVLPGGLWLASLGPLVPGRP
jgi:hypothetical protein